MIGPLAYIGGKRRLAPALIRLFPSHVTYVEPFCGGAQVFFHKPPSRVEVLNDIDGEVVNFLRVCREHPTELRRTLRFHVPSRATFAQFAAQDPGLLTDVQRAARFLYLQKNCFAGKILGRNFHYTVTKPSNFNPSSLPEAIERAAARLSRVQLESQPYEEVIVRYDRPRTLFYLDPPYAGLSLYRRNFSDADYAAMAKRLATIRGKFLLSINDTPETRAAFGGFDKRTLHVAYTAARRVRRVPELVFSNYRLPSLPDIDGDADR